MAITARPSEAVAVAGRSTVGRRRFNWVPYLFVLPHLIFFAIFLVYPFLQGLVMSTFDYNFQRPEANKFIGLQNYIDLFTPGSVDFPTFWNSLWNTVQFAVYSIPPLIVIPLLLALLLNTKTPGRNIFRAIYFAPWTLSVTVAALIWWWIFQDSGGLLNSYLTQLNITPPQGLGTLPWAWVTIVVATVWWTLGFNMIILLAALQDIPDYLYEAASLDGASRWQQFWRITLPTLRPVLLFLLTIQIIASFNLFGQPYIMTRGGPSLASGGGATMPVMLNIVNVAFGGHRGGMGAAMSFLVAAIMIVVSYLNFRLFRARD